jgi:hypothetical protein
METIAILFVFAGCPLLIFAFIAFASVRRAQDRRKIVHAADKYLKS